MILNTKPWSPTPPLPPAVSKKKTHHHHPISIPMQAPKSDSNNNNNNSPRKPPLSSLKHRRVSFYHLIFTWIILFIVACVAMGGYFFPAGGGGAAALSPPPPAARTRGEGAAALAPPVKIYPFNVYDDGTDRVVRYPPTGAIPKLHWNKVKHYRACCKDDDSLRCFATHEIALRRDSERSQRGVSDVYLEIMRDMQPETTAKWKRLGALGSRCQLIWSEEQAEIES